MNDVRSRAHRLSTASSTTEPVSPVNITSCVNLDFLESTITLGFIDDVSTYEDVTDAAVQTFLEERVKESKDAVTLDVLEKIVRTELRTNMKHSNRKAGMYDLFCIFHTILRCFS